MRARHSAASSLIEDGRTGLVCEPDPASFARAIGALLSDPERRHAMGHAARAAAAERDWDRIAAEMEAVYLSVVERRGRRTRSRDRLRVATSEPTGRSSDAPGEAR